MSKPTTITRRAALAATLAAPALIAGRAGAQAFKIDRNDVVSDAFGRVQPGAVDALDLNQATQDGVTPKRNRRRRAVVEAFGAARVARADPRGEFR